MLSRAATSGGNRLEVGSHSQGVGIRTCPCLRGAESPLRDEANPAPQAELFGTVPGLGAHEEEVIPPFGRAKSW